MTKKQGIKQYTLHKGERLKKRSAIEHLFRQGKSFASPPLRVYHLVVEKEEGVPPIQAGFAVSKRYFKKAVDRNRVKRLMRESYRLQKLPLQKIMEDKGSSLNLFFIYTGNELPQFETVQQATGRTLVRLAELLSKRAG